MEALKKSSQITSLSGFFELMDKTGSGYIEQEDFVGLFHSLNLKIPAEKIESLMQHFWKDKASAIDYKEFLRIFQRY
jgi:Ca2+-binding EF-hand superfamily protein